MQKPILFKQLTYMLAIGSALLTACDDQDKPIPSGKYDNGVLISNEGPFQSGTGTISYFNRSNHTVENDIFQTVNGRPLGNIVQSISTYNGKGYIVVNNANKVEVVNSGDFVSVGVIQDLVLPRYFLGINNQKAYISQWGASGITGSVQVVDLNTNTVNKTIATGKGAERMIKVNDKVYVVCGGGFSSDNLITVINTATDEVLTNIAVGDSPNSIQLDANNKLWVTCSGKKVYNQDYSMNIAQSTAGSLVRINPANNEIELSLPFADVTKSPGEMVINTAKNALFFTYAGKTYRHDINSSSLDLTPFINRSFYELGIDPANNLLYGTDPVDYSSTGKVIRYNSASGTAIDTLQVGIIPGGFEFR